MPHAAPSTSGFNELVDTAGVTGCCVRQTTISGETYVVNVATGEKIIPGSRRPDGTMRKPIKVRPGYTPVEERRAFRTRQQVSRDEHRAHVGSSIPGLTPVDPLVSSGERGTSKSRRKKSAANNENTMSSSPSNANSKQNQLTDDSVDDKLAQQVQSLSLKNDAEQPKAVDPSKRLRNVRKKLNEIIELEKKVAEGEKATPEQLEKIGRKAALMAEIAELEKTVSPSP